jgi:hypothetical protein
MASRKEIAETIKVFIRQRPSLDSLTLVCPNNNEESPCNNGNSGIISITDDRKSCEYFSASTRTKQCFQAHHFFPTDCNQEDIFITAARDIADSVLQGYSGSILAYGPTGSGKSFTMRGDDASPGIIPRCLAHLLANKPSNMELWATYVQIYCEQLTDLLSLDARSQLSIREKGDGSEVFLDGAAKHRIDTLDDLHTILQHGDENRATAATNCNETSSRSHAVLQLSALIIEEGSSSAREGRLVLVDLAGSERASASSGRAFQRTEEARSINLSLSALGNVMSALAEKRAHTPYRDSKLTRLLQHSLGNNSRTAIIVTLSPGNEDAQGEALNALRFAQRALLVQVVAKVAPKVLNYEALYYTTLNKLQSLEQQQQNLTLAVADKALLSDRDEVIAQQAEQIASLTQQLAALQADNQVLLRSPLFPSSSSSDLAADGDGAKYWQDQVQALRAQHSEQLKQLQQQRAQEAHRLTLASKELQSDLAQAQSTLYSEREQLLRAMQDLRALTERHAQQENYYKSRLAELLQELEAMQSSRDDVTVQMQSISEQNSALSEQVQTLKAGMQRMVSVERVAEMEALFLDTVNRLTNRVQHLEGSSNASSASNSSSISGKNYKPLPVPSARESCSHLSTNISTLGPDNNKVLSAYGGAGDGRLVRLEPGRIRAASQSGKGAGMLHSHSSNAV